MIGWKAVAAATALVVLSGCGIPVETGNDVATAPHQDVDTLPMSLLAEDNAFTGIVVYGDRGYTGISGDINYPNIRINGLPVGKCAKREAMMIPLPPGTHVVSAHSENTVEHSVTLGEGEVRYFRCNFMRIGGILFPPAVLDPATAETAFDVVNGG